MTAENFWDRIDVRGEDECWEWQRSLTNKGYGSLGPKRSNRFRISLAHRLAYFLANGELDPKLFVIHSCDNRACCNPKHLRQGTNMDNVKDMLDRGRHGGPRGAAHPRTKLTPEIATDIRWLRTMGATLVAIGNAFDIEEQTVRRVVRGESWC